MCCVAKCKVAFRWEKTQCLQARAACDGALAGQIPAYKAATWLRQLANLRHHNDTLAQHVEAMSLALAAAQQAKDACDLKLQHAAQTQVG